MDKNMEVAEEQVHISVRNLVEFILRSGDIDNRVAGTDKDAMLLGGKMHRKIQRRMGADYHAEVPLKIEIPCNGFTLVIDGRADGIIENASDIVIDEIKGVMRDLEQIEEPVSVHLAQAKCYAYIYATQKNLDEIGVQMTYCNLETEDIRRFQSVYAYEDLKRWFLDVAGQYENGQDIRCDGSKRETLLLRKLNFHLLTGKDRRTLRHRFTGRSQGRRNSSFRRRQEWARQWQRCFRQ